MSTRPIAIIEALTNAGFTCKTERMSTASHGEYDAVIVDCPGDPRPNAFNVIRHLKAADVEYDAIGLDLDERLYVR